MKKDTKACLIIFVGVFILAYVMTLFVPDDIMALSNNNGLLSFFGSSVARLVGIRTIVALAIAVAVTLLVRIVDPEEKSAAPTTKTTKKIAKKTVAKKEA